MCFACGNIFIGYVCIKFNLKTIYNPKPNSMKKSIYLIAAGLLVNTFTFAQEAAKKDEGKFTVSGYIDSYYLTSFNNPVAGDLTAGKAGRAFDRLTDQFALGLVQTKFAYTNAKSEMVIDLTFGPNAELGNFGNTKNYFASYLPTSGPKNGLYGTSAAIKQAYFTYKFTDKLSMTVGQFGTHIGYEVIDAPVNFHYSLSNLFNNGPFYHVGGKLNYAFSDKFGIMVGLVNNWDALTAWSKSKSVIGQVYVSPVEGWNVYLNAIVGANDDPFRVAGTNGDPNSIAFYNSGVTYNRMLFDLTTGYQITDKFYCGLNAAYGSYSFDSDYALLDAAATLVKSAAWYGAALYPNYKINDMFSIGVRAEYFNDPKGVRYFGGWTMSDGSTGASNIGITVTAPITLADGHLQIKPEFRYDVANKDYYWKKDGTQTKSQQTLGLAFIYKY